MTDLVQRLRDSATQARALDRAALLHEAADEIERLRSALSEYTDGISPSVETKFTLTHAEREQAVPKEKPAEVSFTLTDAEREALWFAIAYAQNAGHGCEATLRGLMERMQ